MELEARDLAKIFPPPPFAGRPGFAALAGVSFRAGAGLLLLEGPNGSGKTTLLKVLAGVLEQDSGKISFGGRVFCAAARRRAAAFCPANARSFYFRLSALENLRFFGALSGLPAERALALARELGGRLGLRAEELERRFDKLSEGAMQKVNLVRALSRPASALLLDEPFRGLDAAACAALAALLNERAAAAPVLAAGHALPGLAPQARLRLAAGRLEAA